MRCGYCYNCDIVTSQEGKYTLDDLFGFLKKRRGLLDGVVLSGGEASLHDLVFICEKIKDLGFEIKLDTNGSNPKLLEKLLQNKLLDFVALDFKGTKEKFESITKANFYEEFLNSLKLLNKFDIPFEVRTTLHRDLLDENDINTMQNILIENGYKKTFFIQNFLETKNFDDLQRSDMIFDISKLEKNLDILFRN